MTYRIAVLDDEIRELQKTEEMLSLYGKTHPEDELRTSCYSEMGKFMEAVCGGEEKAVWDYDILLMDIYLPDGNGIEGARLLRQKGFQGVIIFKSSSEEHAIDAFSVGALQYLVKPVSQEKLDRTMGKAVKEARCTVRKTEEEIYRWPGSGICCGKDQSGGQPLRYIIDTFFTKRKQESRHDRISGFGIKEVQDMDEQRAWIKSRRKKRLRLLAVVLAFCLLFTTYPDILETLSVFAAGIQGEEDMRYISRFVSLPEEVREQTVPVGTGTEELSLPDTLEAVIAVSEGETPPENTDAGEEAEHPEDTDTQPEDASDADDAGQPDETEETEPEAAGEADDTEENTDADEQEEQDAQSEESSEEETIITQETHTVTMPWYCAENIITVETIENAQEVTVTIESVTWESLPAYDGNTEGTYVFTAVLPEGYALMEGVSLPEITVTVQDSGEAAMIQALLERIEALPDAEGYLAEEPDIEEEEAYEEWMEGLYEYAGEALDIQEAYEALTEVQQAQIPEEALDRLAAWVEIAEETVLLSVAVLDDGHSHPVCGANCSHGNTHGSIDDWSPITGLGGELTGGNYYLTEDVVTTGKINIQTGDTVNICLNGHKISYSAPASDGAEITIPDRPAPPAAKQVTVTDTTATVTNPAAGEEYVLVPKGQTPDWSSPDTTGKFTGLDPNKEYDLYVRKKATGSSFASEPVKTEIRTSVTIKEPVITGDGAGKNGNTAPKPGAPDAGGGTVTYTGTYSEEYTPVIITTDGQEHIPDMTWNESSKKGGWEYTHTIPDSAAEVQITVEFRKRALTGITVTPDSLTIYADNAANGSMEALNDYVGANSSVQAAYDNKTSGAVQAAYTATESFAAKGTVYHYNVSADGKTKTITLAVSPVTAQAAAPDSIMKKQQDGGYTAAQVSAWLPAQVTVTYTGTGYTARTESRTVTWDTSSIGSDFGASRGDKTITGTVDLPAWATGQDSVSIVITFVDKTPLEEDQMQLNMPGFSYGAQTLPNPSGSITVTDTNPDYTYLYSTDGGNTWVTADKLPKSGGGYITPGEYEVKMTYTGDNYTGEKTASFTVGKKALDVLPGTLAVEDKNYDRNMDASLKEGGQAELSGVVAGDDVTLGGSLSASFTEAGPKKDIPVTVTGFRLEGSDAGYYELKNTTLTLKATINNADGTPPSDGNSGGSSGGNSGGGNSGSGGSSSGGDNHDDDGNSGNTPGDNNSPGTPAVTPPPVTSPADTLQPAPGTGADSGKKTETQPAPGQPGQDTETEGKDTDAVGQGSADSAQNGTEKQPESGTVQTVPASVNDGRIVISGGIIETGNLTKDSETTTQLAVGDGAVIVTVVCEEGKVEAGVADTVAVANAVLTPEQIQLVGGGETIEVRIDIKDISQTVAGQDKEVIENGLAAYREELPGLTLGMYVDISLFIRICEGGWDAVTSTEEPIEVVIGIPEELKEDGREFYIIRSHAGEYTLLTDMDNDEDTITVSTDLFSAYALAYEQADMQKADTGSGRCGLCHICPTFLGICCFIWLAVIILAILIIGIVIRKKRKEQEEQEEQV